MYWFLYLYGEVVCEFGMVVGGLCDFVIDVLKGVAICVLYFVARLVVRSFTITFVVFGLFVWGGFSCFVFVFDMFGNWVSCILILKYLYFLSFVACMLFSTIYNI